MTLKEKFSDVQDAYHDRSDECEKIADEFAIGFAEWCCAKTMGTNNFKLYEGELEMYKKEKGL
jgi:hypothetical protein